MPVALMHLFFDACVIAVQKHQLHFFSCTKPVSICVCQRRASEHSIVTSRRGSLNQLAQAFQPRLSVFIGEWYAAFHFIDVGARMKVVCLIETPAELVREQLAQCGFSRAGNTENDHDHGASICRWRPILSTRNATAT